MNWQIMLGKLDEKRGDMKKLVFFLRKVKLSLAAEEEIRWRGSHREVQPEGRRNDMSMCFDVGGGRWLGVS
jgi:hypothetical protein